MKLKSYSLFDFAVALFIAIYCIAVIIPIINVLAISVSNEDFAATHGFYLIPGKFSVAGYEYLINSPSFVRSMLNSVYITVIGTLYSIIISMTLAYAMSKRALPGRRMLMSIIVMTMFIPGGLIPDYMLVKSLGFLNNFAALIVPVATTAFIIIIIKTFFMNLPESLDESAKMDGASEARILISIAVPLSLPILATFSLFFMVGYWNAFLSAVLYLNDYTKWPIQVYLRQLLIVGTQKDLDAINAGLLKEVGENMQMAAIIIATLPIIITYPFLQKHFAKGMILGAVKG